MKPNGKDGLGLQFLSGWKDIATYLDKGVRTVQRYEREFGLPVRRPAGRDRGSVVATKTEMDAWVAASPIREAYELVPRAVEAESAAIRQIKLNMEEMRRLSRQMTALKTQLIVSVELVQRNVVDLTRQVARNLPAQVATETVESDGALAERTGNVVSFRDGRRRVS